MLLSACNDQAPVETNLDDTDSMSVSSADSSGSQNSNDSTDEVEWDLYKNEALGFEINLPEKVANGPITMVEEGDVVWLVNENDPSKSELERRFNNADSDFERVQGLSWAILVKEVQNDQELEQFIKDRYGEDCGLGEKIPSSQEGVMDVMVDTGDFEPGEGCFLNWVLHIKYSPELQKVAAWDIGQDIVFADEYGSSNSNVYDFQMSDSFRFIE